MDWTTIIVAALTVAGSLVGNYIANRKNAALMDYRLEQLERKQDKHNNLIERTYALEQRTEIQEEKIKVANHRIEDLEKAVGK